MYLQGNRNVSYGVLYVAVVSLSCNMPCIAGAMQTDDPEENIRWASSIKILLCYTFFDAPVATFNSTQDGLPAPYLFRHFMGFEPSTSCTVRSCPADRLLTLASIANGFFIL